MSSQSLEMISSFDDVSAVVSAMKSALATGLASTISLDELDDWRKTLASHLAIRERHGTTHSQLALDSLISHI